MYILLSGQPPFDGEDDAQILENVRIGDYEMDHKTWGSISQDAKNLIKRMLTVDYR